MSPMGISPCSLLRAVVGGRRLATPGPTTRASSGCLELTEDPPDLARVVVDTCNLGDQLTGRAHRPGVAGEASRARRAPQCRADLRQLLGAQSRPASGDPSGQCVTPTLAPAGVPSGHRLVTDAKPAGDLGLANAGLEEPGRRHPPDFELPGIAGSPVGRCRRGSGSAMAGGGPALVRAHRLTLGTLFRNVAPCCAIHNEEIYRM